MSAVLFSNPMSHVSEEELLSALCFIEMHCNRNRLKRFQFQVVILREKNVWGLLDRLDIFMHRKMIVIDHEGAAGWKNSKDVTFEIMRHSFVPIQPTPFQFGNANGLISRKAFREKIRDSWFRRLSHEISAFLVLTEFNIVDHWITAASFENATAAVPEIIISSDSKA